MSLEKLMTNGWVHHTGITTDAELLTLANSYGCPLHSPNGKFITELSPKNPGASSNRTFSEIYGKGVFPLHTDTAFWPLPAKIVILNSSDRSSRPTTICRIDNLLENIDPEVRLAIEASIWITRTPSSNFYCAMTFKFDGSIIWRYDHSCMFPANKNAKWVKPILDQLTTNSVHVEFEWKMGDALILNNWAVLHGRGESKDDDERRKLKRVYLK